MRARPGEPGIPAGAVLVGGASRRMGRDKATIEVDGVAMGARVGAALVAAGCAPVVVVGGSPSLVAPLGFEVVADQWPGEGPLGAIISVLDRFDRDGAEAVVIAACDLPWLDAATVGVLLRRFHCSEVPCDVVVALSDRPEPLCAVWTGAALPVLRARFLAGERAVHRVFDALRVEAVEVDRRRVVNLNTPDDLTAAVPPDDPPTG